MSTVLSLWPGERIYACDCGIPPNAQAAVDESSAAFTGKVIQMKQDRSEGEDVVLLEVTQAWKGVTDSQVIVRTTWSSCQFEFEQGREYLLYPYTKKDELYVINCGRSAEISQASLDLEQLGTGTTPTNKVSLEDDFRPLWLRGLLISIPLLLLAGLLLLGYSRLMARRKRR
ncbi:hypothetical protein FHS18_004657 [Paenibacillus phyllosphaerae]|uniref:CbiN domain protein n=1 Tax=Paenibacillus phyllosphaerae TaxID=274593 RepID=A0A7W5FPN2_9BACL|nr:hypothetical protein [Paenibacillus phyllosphaerae]MBB3112556.1 hypothetical protein [Paenibacillus phyllosphaerae]